jgi:hypothetical protein
VQHASRGSYVAELRRVANSRVYPASYISGAGTSRSAVARNELRRETRRFASGLFRGHAPTMDALPQRVLGATIPCSGLESNPDALCRRVL